jgi:hypothetical protein
VEDCYGRRGGAQRGPAGVEISGLRALATPLGSILRMRLPGNGWSGYHRRSRVETKMHCVKLLRQRLPYMVCRQTITGQRMARDFDRQVA